MKLSIIVLSLIFGLELIGLFYSPRPAWMDDPIYVPESSKPWEVAI